MRTQWSRESFMIIVIIFPTIMIYGIKKMPAMNTLTCRMSNYPCTISYDILLIWTDRERNTGQPLYNLIIITWFEWVLEVHHYHCCNWNNWTENISTYISNKLSVVFGEFASCACWTLFFFFTTLFLSKFFCAF